VERFFYFFAASTLSYILQKLKFALGRLWTRRGRRFHNRAMAVTTALITCATTVCMGRFSLIDAIHVISFLAEICDSITLGKRRANKLFI
jgi:hypothetical protein